MRNGIAECLELPVDRGERDRALLDQSLELRAVTAKLLLRAVELDEHGHLGAQNGWDDGREHEIDGTQVVAASHIGLGLVERSYEDERRELRTGALSDQLCRLETVHDRHPDVQQDHREFISEQLPQGIGPRRGFDDVFVEWGEDGT